MAQPIVVLVTCPNQGEAETIATAILDQKLVACVNFLPSVESWYWWEGKIHRDPEILLVMKTQEDRFPLLESVIRQNHSYAVPEIIAIPIVYGSVKYLEWINQTVNG
jgi:periplasmic divalent cation tolerance protein